MAELNIEKLQDIFMQNNNTCRIPQAFMNYARDTYHVNPPVRLYGNRMCPGRAIQKVYRETVCDWYSSNMYSLISVFCTRIKMLASGREYYYMLTPYWLQITQEQHEAGTFTPEYITNLLWQQTPRDTRIQRVRLVHIASGKSYLREMLDDNNEIKAANRVKGMEMYLIQNTSHFIRVYSKFPYTSEQDIVIFTDIVNEQLIRQIYLQFPNLFNLTEESLIEQFEAVVRGDENFIKRGVQTIKDFRILFNTLYAYAHPSPDVHITLDNVQSIIKTFTEYFANNTEAINNFINKLATAQTDKLSRNLTRTISTTVERINSLERDLERYYNQKAEAEIQLNALKTAEEVDLTEFKEILFNNKAIEIMDVSNNSLFLRITAPLQYFHPSDFEAYERNSSSGYRQLYTTLPIQRVMHKIFVERKYTMPIQALIRMALDTTGDVPVCLSNDTGGNEYTTLANPHIRYYNCWEKARKEIANCMAKAEFDLALMTMIAAVQTVNIAENATFVNKTLRDIRDSAIRKTIILTNVETKETISFDDAIKLEAKLIEEETKKAEEAASPPEARGYTQQVIEEETITPEEAMESLPNQEPIPQTPGNVELMPQEATHLTGEYENTVNLFDPLTDPAARITTNIAFATQLELEMQAYMTAYPIQAAMSMAQFRESFYRNYIEINSIENLQINAINLRTQLSRDYHAGHITLNQYRRLIVLLQTKLHSTTQEVETQDEVHQNQ